jgi:hypothetical protein
MPLQSAQAAASALISIPGYQSIARDLQEIELHNERAQRISEILRAIGNAPAADPGRLTNASVLPPDSEKTYWACRSVQVRDAAVEGILNDARGRAYFSSLSARRSSRILVESFNYWPHDVLPETLQGFDVFFRMRRAAHLAHSLMRRVKKKRTAVDSGKWELVNRYFKLYEMTEWALVSWLNQWTFDWRKLGRARPRLDIHTKRSGPKLSNKSRSKCPYPIPLFATRRDLADSINGPCGPSYRFFTGGLECDVPSPSRSSFSTRWYRSSLA